jgi:hypothetical protein
MLTAETPSTQRKNDQELLGDLGVLGGLNRLAVSDATTRNRFDRKIRIAPIRTES